MNESQKEIASQAISNIIQLALEEKEPPSAEQLEQLAVDAAKALRSAFAVLDETILPSA